MIESRGGWVFSGGAAAHPHSPQRPDYLVADTGAHLDLPHFQPVPHLSEWLRAWLR